MANEISSTFPITRSFLPTHTDSWQKTAKKVCILIFTLGLPLVGTFIYELFHFATTHSSNNSPRIPTQAPAPAQPAPAQPAPAQPALAPAQPALAPAQPAPAQQSMVKAHLRTTVIRIMSGIVVGGAIASVFALIFAPSSDLPPFVFSPINNLASRANSYSEFGNHSSWTQQQIHQYWHL